MQILKDGDLEGAIGVELEGLQALSAAGAVGIPLRRIGQSSLERRDREHGGDKEGVMHYEADTVGDLTNGPPPFHCP